MTPTDRYYKEHAHEFFDSTVEADISSLYERFLGLLPKGARILDLGCGSGRDARRFIERGYKVDALDGSMELCKMAGEHAGIDVKCMDFFDVDAPDTYDAIWACASLLHVERGRLPALLEKLLGSLRKGGIFYLSFKHGDFEGERDGRHYLDMTEQKFKDVMAEVTGCGIVDMWRSDDVRQEKDFVWLNILLRKGT